MKCVAIPIALAVIVAIAGSLFADADRGQALFESKDYDEASRVFEAMLERDGDDPNALYYLGRISYERADLKQAREYLEKLTKVAPNNAEYEFQLSRVYGELARTSGFFMTKKKYAGKWKERLEHAVELDPNHAQARRWLALYLLNAPGFGGGDKDRGTEIARETIPIDEKVGRQVLSYAYRKTGQMDLAIEECETLIASYPSFGEAYGALGYTLMQTGEFEDARRAFEKWIELDPNNYEAYQAMSYYCEKRELPDELIVSQLKLLELNPLYSDTRFDVAQHYDDRDELDDAVYHYEQLVTLTPEHHRAGKAKKRLKKLKNPKRYGR
jgi:tetratricopeptide (TPR) repeat protein